jgi:hypothetical protein
LPSLFLKVYFLKTEMVDMVAKATMETMEMEAMAHTMKKEKVGMGETVEIVLGVEAEMVEMAEMALMEEAKVDKAALDQKVTVEMVAMEKRLICKEIK